MIHLSNLSDILCYFLPAASVRHSVQLLVAILTTATQPSWLATLRAALPSTEFLPCFRLPACADCAAACNYLSNCYSAQLDGNTVCFPSWMRSYDQTQLEQLLSSLKAFDAAWYGNCAGTCWMKQVGERVQHTEFSSIQIQQSLLLLPACGRQCFCCPAQLLDDAGEGVIPCKLQQSSDSET
jgi:hypothetical protein